MRIFEHQLLLLVGLLAPLAGCNQATVVRTTTIEVADQIELLNQSVQEYHSVIEESAARRIDRLAEERVDLDRLEYEAAERTAVWMLAGDEDAVSLLSGVEQIASERVDAERAFAAQLAKERAALKASQRRLRNQRQILATLSKQLRSLAEVRDFQARVEFLVDFGQDVRAELKTLQEKLEELDNEPGASSPAGES